MTPYNKEAIEAAVDAFKACEYDTESCVIAALKAAHDSAVSQGLSREAMGQEVLGAWIADTSEQVEEPNEFPVTIIREVK